MTDPFTFDPARMESDIDYEGGERHITLPYLAPLLTVSASGEESADAMDLLKTCYDEAVAGLSPHQRLEWIAAACREGGV
ncbi:hypothetical protein [Paracoccus sp. Ld10]|uniref:hypothetical protein n=1 Tax=Paracoccus sp. Ld10 TaxID=649158 RepID=UPI00386D2EDC